MAKYHQLTVNEVRRETRDAVSLRLEVPDAEREYFEFLPGQHLAMRATIDGESVTRTYSICTAPRDGEIRVAVKRDPQGVFSTFANERLKAGDVLEVMPPEGSFVLRFSPDNRKHYLAVAAGSGITPIMSMIREGLAAEPRSSFTLVYGNRSAQNMIFREQLEDIKNEYMGRFTMVPVMSREQTDIGLFHGHIDGDKCRELLQHWIRDDVDECVICGPEPMIQAVSETLREAGVPRDRIHYELFTAPGEALERRRQRAQDTSIDHSMVQVEVRVDGQRYEFELARNTESVLDGGMSVGAELPHSCKSGVCSTCRARLVEGEVEMDVNYALEDYEVEAGYILTCQSLPVSSRVVVDYDQ
ncbi:1,2-phenylacetyl-CoA epoxidase subunit PaaE [Aquisalimonas sp.]|uniref:1,2-phenylacetyl-CoA epoxidase subunit PaaE n=1 Tax=unclassified Aquisalimonas TaxID=2644645 RepID=UPI0025C3D5FD|nr:1,2-phenylacetyl-CoA epoxidase subunit PaaE [Aquisalimonas sp.]